MDLSTALTTVRLLLFASLFSCTVGLWWSLGDSDPLVFHNRLCRKVRRIKVPLRTLCRRDNGIIMQVVRGSANALTHCRAQFQSQRWNCSLHKRSLKQILKRDTKEAAVLNAFVAAGITHAIAESCSTGELAPCRCLKKRAILGSRLGNSLEPGPPPGKAGGGGGFPAPWADCKNGLSLGLRISRKVGDGGRRRRGRTATDVRTVVRFHNGEAGRQVVKSNMKRACKCHGLSGSCTHKTCALKMPSMQRVARELFLKYSSAVKVTANNDGKSLMPLEGKKSIRRDDLVFLEESPNFCRRNLRLGSLGTRGRECEASSPSLGSCELLCCEKGYNTRVEQISANCNCRFTFCCKVHCEKCQVAKIRTFCN